MITAKATIDLNAIKHNFEVLNKKAGKQKLIVVVKGNAYGHGAVDVAKALPMPSTLRLRELKKR
ncbi:hypothetical protein JCM19233_6906 [Vibrio astriarenae]|nr:hypothetical protein JCM19233_6906 [Vibrio sp. C7]